jgi:hypothetical protein
MAKPFEPVERLPVPEEVASAFQRLKKAETSRGFVSRVQNTSERVTRWRKANEAVSQAEAAAAEHFGGDVGKMGTHFKRWTRWGGKAMGAGDFALPKESFEKGMSEARETVERPSEAIRKARVKPRRREVY